VVSRLRHAFSSVLEQSTVVCGVWCVVWCGVAWRDDVLWGWTRRGERGDKTRAQHNARHDSGSHLHERCRRCSTRVYTRSGVGAEVLGAGEGEAERAALTRLLRRAGTSPTTPSPQNTNADTLAA